jgi:general secretion pathway protein A
MYESFFGLKEKAFNLTPDPDFLFLNGRTKEAFEDILHGIERRDGFAVVVGDVGTGKTTLCCALLEKLQEKKNIFTVLIQNPMLSELDILRSILQDLGAPQRFGELWRRDMTKKELIDCLNTFLAENARSDAFTVLIIDESQNLSLEMLEQLRLLSNLETTKKKLLQIILLGQPELGQKLTRLRQLNQRISLWFETKPLLREDTEKYIRHRLAIAGIPHRVRVGPAAFNAIHELSRGYPRLINLICDRGLREAYKKRSLTVTKQVLRKASLGLGGIRGRADKSPLRIIKLVTAATVILVAVSLILILIGDRRVSTGDSSGKPVGNTSVSPVPAQPKEQPSVELPPKEQPWVQPPAPEPPAPSRPPPKAQGTTSQYLLQVHSLKDRDIAYQSVEELRALNLPSFLEYQSVGGDEGWYVVYTGPFSDLETAQRANSEIRAATGASPILRERFVRQENAPPQSAR